MQGNSRENLQTTTFISYRIYRYIPKRTRQREKILDTQGDSILQNKIFSTR